MATGVDKSFQDLGTRIQELGSRKGLKTLVPRTAKGTSIHTSTAKQVEMTAYDLADKFKSPGYYPFFLKVAWRLSRAAVERIAETALKHGKNPRAYFIALAKEAMK
jgi:hypothetical protein